MGRRALRTGDLVVARRDEGSVAMHLEPDRRSRPVGRFTFGLYMGTVMVRETNPGRTATSHFVLDSTTCIYGWVRSNWVGRLR